nr:hypothetical protein [Candidatus Njordarchaeum guaymaensis]
MRKTTAGKIVIGLVNVAFIVVLATAVISVVPPAYNFSPGTITATPVSPSTLRLSMSYTVTNKGFYAIQNFYVQITVKGPTDEAINQTSTPPATIERGTSPTGTITINLNRTYITAHPGTYKVSFIIHSEFAYRLLKFTLEIPTTTTWS